MYSFDYYVLLRLHYLHSNTSFTVHEHIVNDPFESEFSQIAHMVK